MKRGNYIAVSKKAKITIILTFFLFMTLVSFFTSNICLGGEKAEASQVKSAVCVMERSSRRVLYAENADMRLPMASTTKILTAATVIEEGISLKEEVEIPKEAVGVEGSSIYLQEGEKYTLEELLYGLMLRSGNDAATALALKVGGSIPDFCAKMNLLAQKSGAINSRFSNPHGLPQKNHYTTATDLSLITAYAMQSPTFCQIAATKYYEPKNWYNKNKLLSSFDGAIGVKTGYTQEAGRCLVAAAEKDWMQVICTLLNCYDHYATAKRLLTDAFANYKMYEVVSKNESFSLKIGKRNLRGAIKESCYYPLLEEEKAYLTRHIRAYEEEKADGGIGEIEISLAKRLIFSEKLYKL